MEEVFVCLCQTKHGDVFVFRAYALEQDAIDWQGLATESARENGCETVYWYENVPFKGE